MKTPNSRVNPTLKGSAVLASLLGSAGYPIVETVEKLGYEALLDCENE